MFCSKCGKTIHATDVTCPHCQTAIGDNRFGGIPYTSAQFTIAPGQTTFEPVNNYTRTTYTSRGEQAEEGGEVDSRTTYRPVYESDPIPRDLRIELKNGPKIGDVVEDDDTVANFIPGVPLSQAAKDTLSELDEELKPDEQIDRSQFKSRPIESAGRAGISRDVSEYIRHLEDSQSRKTNSRRRGQNVYDDYAAEEPAEDYAPQEDGYIDEDVYEEIDPDDYEDDRRAPFSVGQIVKIVIALVVVAALVFGLVTWIRYVRGNQSSAPIEGVSETLYEQGIATIESHVDSEYVNNLVAQYTNDGLLTLSTSLTEATGAINALMPEEPAANDQTFMDALLAIESNIGNAVISDAVAAAAETPNESDAAQSQANWQIVNNSIAQLKTATSAAELTAIINGQTISVQTATPAPTEEPVTYNPLSRGDENNDVMRLQVRLYELGYLNDDRDGVYGGKTQTAVGLFQQTIGMEATGIADSDTQARLYADDAPYAPGSATPTPEPTTAPTPEPTEDLIQPAEAGGTEGNAV